jgi:cytochrome c oxidase assembly factor CtaG/putative copper export protein
MAGNSPAPTKASTGTGLDSRPAAEAPQSPKAETNARTDRRLWIIGGGALLIFGLLLGLYLGGAAYQTPAPGLPDPGAFVGWGLPLAKLGTVVFGTLTVGFLINAAFLLPSAGKGIVSRVGRRDLILASFTAALWSFASVMALLFTHATSMGEPLLEALDPGTFFTYAFEVPQNVAYLLSAITAAIVAIGTLFTSRTGAALVWLILAGVALVLPPLNAHGSGSGDHALALTADSLHAAAAAAWVGGLVALTLHVFKRDRGAAEGIRRFSALALVALLVLAASGVASAYTRLERPEDLWSTAYGVLVMIKVVLLIVLAAVAAQSRRTAAAGVAAGRSSSRLRWIVTETLLMATTVGIAVSITLTAYPRVDIPLGSPGEELLGFPYPEAPTAGSVLFGWYPDAFWLVVCSLLAGGYLWGVSRLYRNHISWPVGRTISWLFGIFVVAWSTNAGIAGYGQVSVGWHMVQHMTLAMLSPILMVLGMPATLALRAFRPAQGGDRGPREWIVWGLHTPVSKLVTHPVYVLVIGTFGLFGLYFTPLFAMAMTSHIGHVVMMGHFLLSGFLFYWVVLGLDPGPRSVPPWARLILLLVYISLHSFFAIAIMSMTTPLASEWYERVQPPWLADLTVDTTTSGGIAWGFGEIPSLLVMIVVAVQWSRSDAREAKRHDRQADRDGDADLHAYNDYLARLSGESSPTPTPDIGPHRDNPPETKT